MSVDEKSKGKSGLCLMPGKLAGSNLWPYHVESTSSRPITEVK